MFLMDYEGYIILKENFPPNNSYMIQKVYVFLKSFKMLSRTFRHIDFYRNITTSKGVPFDMWNLEFIKIF